MPTEMSDFLESVLVLLARAPFDAATPPSSKGSLLAAPMAELADTSRTFEAVYGSTGLLLRLAEETETAGDTALAGMLRDISDGIDRGTLQPPAPPEAVRRFTGFVYPVI